MRTSTFVSTFALTASVALAADENPYTKYPSVAKTATINGFADRIYADLPECAKDCVRQDTGNTPCPYWDTGCLCVMPQFNNLIAECWIEKCGGADISSARYLATSLCSTAGVWDPYWFVAASYTTALEKAQDAAATTTDAQAEQTTAPETSPTVEPTTAKETTAPETTEEVPAETKPAETQPAETQPAESELAETQPAQSEAAETKPAETEGALTQAAESEPAETQPSESKAAASEAAESAAPVSKAPEAVQSEATKSESGSPSGETTEESSAPGAVEQANSGVTNIPSLILTLGGVVGALFILA